MQKSDSGHKLVLKESLPNTYTEPKLDNGVCNSGTKKKTAALNRINVEFCLISIRFVYTKGKK